MMRIDHRFTGRDSSYVRYNIDDGITTSALGTAGAASTVSSRMQNFVLEETHVFSPVLVNEAQFGFDRNTYVQTQNTGSPLNIVVSGFSQIYESYSKTQAGQSFSINDT